MTQLAQHKQQAADWFAALRDDLCARFEALEDDAGSSARFTRTPWQREGGGGGVMALMKGRVFEKVGVNISVVTGEFSPGFAHEIPGASADPRYWAAGISLVAHTANPHAPNAHMNTRMIVVGGDPHARLWFGGGGDLNPALPDTAQRDAFHRAFADCCDAQHPQFYAAFSAWCDEYFYLPHRKLSRGVGGIFYDYLGLNTLSDHPPLSLSDGTFGRGGTSGPATRAGMELAASAITSWQEGFAFTQAVGRCFAQTYPALVAARHASASTAEERQAQLVYRGRYAEYNLLYDRGTRFGLMTGGHTPAILMSLPPLAAWE